MSLSTRRRAFKVRTGSGLPAIPRLAIVITRSTKGRSSLAFGTVVSMCSWRSSSDDRLRSSAIRCSVTRPSLRLATRWRIDRLLRLLLVCGLVEPHAEAQPHALQDLLDLVQRLAAEVLRLEHL